MGAGASTEGDHSAVSDSCKAFCGAFSPMAQKSGDAKTLRAAAWTALDGNENGHVSLDEADTWIKQQLTVSLGDAGEGERLWKHFRPSYIRAFNDAKDLSDRAGGEHALDYVHKVEFRGFLAYLCLYAGMYDAFALIGAGGGDAADADRKMTLEEWRAGAPKVAPYPFFGLQKAGSEGADLEAIFAEIKAGDEWSDGDWVSLRGFCAYIERMEVAGETAWGKLLTAGEDRPKAPGPQAPAAAEASPKETPAAAAES